MEYATSIEDFQFIQNNDVSNIDQTFKGNSLSVENMSDVNVNQTLEKSFEELSHEINTLKDTLHRCQDIKGKLKSNVFKLYLIADITKLYQIITIEMNLLDQNTEPKSKLMKMKKEIIPLDEKRSEKRIIKSTEDNIRNLINQIRKVDELIEYYEQRINRLEN